MAIKLNNLKKLANVLQDQRYAFKDLHLDFQKETTFDPIGEKKMYVNDIEVSYDELAIRNSLRNLFNTKKGQRFLFPLYGLDLYQYLFEPVSDDVARIIGEDIVMGVEKYEPRVQVVNCIVNGVPDENLYEIDLVLSIPRLRTTFTMIFDLDLNNQTFIYLNTSRNK